MLTDATGFIDLPEHPEFSGVTKYFQDFFKSDEIHNLLVLLTGLYS